MVPREAMIAVYMMSNRRHGTLYVGVTSALVNRVLQHRTGELGGFTCQYGLKRLVWYELHVTMVSAIQRETSLKRYKREWKTNLIEAMNPAWDDLFEGVAGGSFVVVPPFPPPPPPS